jgi:UDP-glucose 4-epimerase
VLDSGIYVSAILQQTMTRVFITGGAGFIGSNLADRLLDAGREVVVWDSFVTGQEAFLTGARRNPACSVVRGDNLDTVALKAAMEGCDFVFHLAANADVRHGLAHPERDLQQNTIATFNVLEAMRANGIKKIAFSSTGSVYGECEQIPTAEDAPFPVQTSLYGASKVACEGLIQAYCEGYGFEGYIYRFVSILGERYTHGHVFDFYKQLREHPEFLRVLGDGTQRKSYLHVGDCVSALLHTTGANLAAGAKGRSLIFNLGTSEYCTVCDSIRWICQRMGLSPRVEFGGGTRGWVGDNPFIFLNTERVLGTGWKPALTIREGIERTVDWLSDNEWIFSARK